MSASPTDELWVSPASLTITIDRADAPSYEFGIHVPAVANVGEARGLAETLPRLVAMHDYLEAKRAEANAGSPRRGEVTAS